MRGLRPRLTRCYQGLPWLALRKLARGRVQPGIGRGEQPGPKFVAMYNAVKG
jgi:hypothetical protein